MDFTAYFSDVCLLSVSVGKDLFGAEPFDPFTCGAADFPPDIQSKLDEMQVSPSCLSLICPLFASAKGTEAAETLKPSAASFCMGGVI